MLIEEYEQYDSDVDLLYAFQGNPCDSAAHRNYCDITEPRWSLRSLSLLWVAAPRSTTAAWLFAQLSRILRYTAIVASGVVHCMAIGAKPLANVQAARATGDSD